MIRTTRLRGIPVVLLGVPEPGLFLSSADLYEEIAGDNDVLLWNRFCAPVQCRLPFCAPALLSGREVHPLKSFATLLRRCPSCWLQNGH